jgi:hypothetical protein
VLHKNRRTHILSLLVPLMAGTIAVYLPATLAATTDPADCPHHLIGSPFEIDASADLGVSDLVTMDPACIDWLDTAGALRGIAQPDEGSGSSDNALGKGASENDADPSIVSGSIPPNKSDLTWFGVNTEPKFVELFWARQNSPKGTTNMDFELNQKFCDPTTVPNDCSGNGQTPDRTPGDKLITYELSNGGTVPKISIRTWMASGWSPAVGISSTNAPTQPCELATNPAADPTQCAIGAVNTTAISDGADGGIGAAGTGLDPFTFGEAAIAFGALFPGESCGRFGSAYLKSRSSDSFTSELKDFVKPVRVDISNCQPTLETRANQNVTVGSSISDEAILSDASADAGGSITFSLYADPTCTTAIFTSEPVPVDGNGVYGPVSYTPASPGTYRWIARYSGDSKNDPIAGQCNDPGEVDTVSRAGSTIATAQTVYPQDTATISASAGGTPTGTVSFQLFGPDNPTCNPSGESAVYSEPNVQLVNVNGVMTAATTNTAHAITAASSSEYHWVASYSGDATHEPSTSNCTESFTLTIDNG